MKYAKFVLPLLTMVLLVLSVYPIAHAQTACQSPGSGNSADYPYDSAANTYLVCTILSAQATVNAYTPTPTPTLMPTPAAIATATGCYMNTDNAFQNNTYAQCIIADVNARADAHNAWWAPIIVFTILISGILLYRH